MMLTGMFYSVARSQTSEFRDTIIIQTLKVMPDIRSDNVEGVRLSFRFNLIYNEKMHARKKPAVLGIRAFFFSENGAPVRAISGTAYHKSDDGLAVSGLDEMNWTNQKNLFLPYYALDLPAGRHSLVLRISAWVKDTSVTEDSRPIAVRGMLESAFQINKPQTRTFRLRLRELRVHATNAKGNYWDFGLFSSNEPDLQHRVVLRSKEHADNVHISSTVEDALSAAWPDFSEPLTISRNDKITLCIYDKDLFFHDLIGAISYGLDEWLRIGAQNAPIYFDRVNTCIIEIEEPMPDTRPPDDR